MARIDLVSWDVDGTLYDRGAFRRWVLATAARHPIAAARELVPVRRFNWALEACRRRGGVLGADLARFDREQLLRLERRWAEPALAAIGPRPGVVETLAAVARRGLPQVVLSDYSADYKLAILGVTARFAAVYAGEALGFIKPRPEGLARVAADFGVEPRRILHVGDGLHTDRAAAAAAGVECAIIGHDIRRFGDLVQWL